MPSPIAVAVDGSPESTGVLTLASEIARALNAPVHVLCTVDRAYALPLTDATEQEAEDYPAAADEECRAVGVLADAVARLRAEGCAAEAMELVGEPAPAIVRAAAALDCRMIVMGHRHLSWLSRLLHPSVCAEVIDTAPCPVLVSN
ncbi:universal stress protein [Sphingomonas sp. C3-2]|uniref:universal stress protein n=1 Tax=Sphingomonas sp. C3-2 TaxID=3062169 RepID=UPI00294AFE83|nr:universal stress protein [Sphingomonas sp. C3-2]WOK36100.1 universal stress protein [Sphingomonas sp. C3-2]